MKPALVVMAKAPLPGKVKSRLAADLTPEQCAGLSLAFLKDAIALASSTSGFTAFLAFTPEYERTLFEQLKPANMRLLPQSGANLGERMYRIISCLGKEGYSPVVIIGTDIPTLQPETLAKALQTLCRDDICLGPSHDGGYYLIGANRACESMFQNIDWGTPVVLKQTKVQARKAGLSIEILEEYDDVDVFTDLKKLYFTAGSTASESKIRVPENTRRWLRQNINLFK